MTVAQEDFWSRRKAKVAQEAVLEDEVVVQPDPELSDEEILASLELPDPDTFALGDDIKGFMSKAVPDHLRRKALRRLWRLNPVLANVDGLVDYGQDFTDSATVIEGMQTAYQVGKGMLAHVQEMARQAEALTQEVTAEEPEIIDEIDVPADDEQMDEPVMIADVQIAAVTAPDVHDLEETPEPRRRMRFAYADQTVQGVPT